MSRGSPRAYTMVVLAALLAVGAATACVGSADSASDASRGAPGSGLPHLLPLSTGQLHYVATTGSDANPGTSERPWRTLQKALDTLRPGQRALVRGGVYTQDLVVRRSGTAAAPITVAAAPGARVVLHAASTSGDTYPVRVTDDASYIRLQGFVIEYARGRSSTNVYFEDDAHHVELSRNDIRFSQDQGIFAEDSTSNLFIVGNRIHHNGQNRESGQHQSHGVYLEGTNHLVANNAIYENRSGFGIQIYPENRGSIVVNNTIVGNGHSAIVVGGDRGVAQITIRNNVLAFNGKYGVQMDSDCPVGPVRVDTNVIWGNPRGAVEGGCSFVETGGGNVLRDPRFLSRRRGNLQVTASSPAVDRGRADYAPATDILGRRRPRGARVDIGAYERAR